MRAFAFLIGCLLWGLAPATTVTKPTTITINAASGACPVTVGPLTLNVTTPRNTGISPFLAFYDATATTDTAITGSTTVFQDVTFTWNFGDSGSSGTSTWAYGSNPGVNSRNVATGGVAAHLYITQGSDTTYNPTVTATDGTNTATCTLGVTAYDPSGSNGFPGTATTCVYSVTDGSLGSGCPSGAATLSTNSFNTALGATYQGSNKRTLFKCGDTFTGDNATIGGTKWSIGAYGGCEGTQTGRPILRDSGSGGELTLQSTPAAGDGRVADLDLEGNNTGAWGFEQPAGNLHITYQITLSNLVTNGNKSNYGFNQTAQSGIVGSVGVPIVGSSSISTFFNFAENNPCATSVTANCWSGNVYNNLDYSALLGNSLTGTNSVGGGGGVETVRISACRMCSIENNNIQSGNGVGAVLKFHNGNTYNSCGTQSSCNPGNNCSSTGPTPLYPSCWTGIFTENVEISDNFFGGISGSNMVENAPQNSGADERIRNVIVERNLFSSGPGAPDGRQILVSAVNESIRDNAFYIATGVASAPYLGLQVARRGVEPTPTAIEVYSNTCNFMTTQSSQACIGFTGNNFSAPGNNSFISDNLAYSPSGTAFSVNTGSNNSFTNNTSVTTHNPSFTNGANFSRMSDFKPTANYTIGCTPFPSCTSVPVFYDALGISWPPTWDLGAVHH